MSVRVREIETAQVVDTTADGRGVAKTSGKTVFVQGALTGETVRFVRRKKRRHYDDAELVAVLERSSQRVNPQCAAFERCGGCSLQHLASAGQLELKQAVLWDNLQRIGDVQPARALPPLTGTVWGYRRKARLAVKYVAAKERVLVGFRERHTPFVADMSRCETLHPRIGAEIDGLAKLIGELSLRDRIPQLEVAVGDNGAALVFRVLDSPTDGDLTRLKTFQQSRDLQVYLQTAGPDSVAPLPGAPEPVELFYRIPRFDLQIHFEPTDFIQVHGEVNCAMIDQAIDLLEPRPDSRVLDLFCGLGNFSLPLSRLSETVVGVDGAADMVRRAGDNARRAGIENAEFQCADLGRPSAPEAPEWRDFDRILLDPPRTGALQMLDTIGRIGAARIVYVSCHPATLARDARQLVADLGYDLVAAGIIDMFPHTSHVESMALFEKRG